MGGKFPPIQQTPTAAAMMVVPDLEDLVDEHLDRVDRVRATIQSVLVDRQHLARIEIK